jgi:hypothetical protein
VELPTNWQQQASQRADQTAADAVARNREQVEIESARRINAPVLSEQQDFRGDARKFDAANASRFSSEQAQRMIQQNRDRVPFTESQLRNIENPVSQSNWRELSGSVDRMNLARDATLGNRVGFDDLRNRGLSDEQIAQYRASGGNVWYGPSTPQAPTAPVVPLDRQPGADAALADLRAANALGAPLAADSPVEQERIAQAATRRQAADRFAQSSAGQQLQQNRDNARMQRMSPEARQNEMQQRGEQNRATAFRERTAAAERAAAPERDLMASQAEKNRAEAAAAGGQGRMGDQERNRLTALEVSKFKRERDPFTGEAPTDDAVRAFERGFRSSLEGRGFDTGQSSDGSVPMPTEGKPGPGALGKRLGVENREGSRKGQPIFRRDGMLFYEDGTEVKP